MTNQSALFLRPGRMLLEARRWLSYRVDLIRAMARWRRSSFDDSPVVLVNPMPKSGTNLIRQILMALPEVAQFAPLKRWTIRTITEQGRTRAAAEVLRDLERLNRGDIALARLAAEPEFMEILTRENWVSFVQIRDPRDLLVSEVFYATEMHTGHAMHEMFLELPEFDDRLALAIRGTSSYPYMPSVCQRYERYLGFLKVPEVGLIRFEDLRQNPDDSIRIILERIRDRGGVEIPSLDHAVEVLRSKISTARSPTFRRGVAGGWRDHFTPRTEAIFREVAGDLLLELGYETGPEWSWGPAG